MKQCLSERVSNCRQWHIQNRAGRGFQNNALLTLDSLAHDAIRQQATPGCVVLVARHGKIIYHKAFGFQAYDSIRPVTPEMIYDMASVTKICATTISIMKLYDQGKLDLDKKLGDYLPWVKGSDKESINDQRYPVAPGKTKSMDTIFQGNH